MAFLVMLLVGLGFLVILPLILLKLVLGLLFLPFKLVGLVFRVVFGVTFGLLGLVFRVLFSGVGLVLALLVAVGVALLVPLLPILLIGVGLWLLLRSSARRPPMRVRPDARPRVPKIARAPIPQIFRRARPAPRTSRIR